MDNYMSNAELREHKYMKESLYTSLALTCNKHAKIQESIKYLFKAEELLDNT